MAPAQRCIHEQLPAQCPTCRRKARAEHRKAIATWMHLHPELSTPHQRREEIEALPLFKPRP